MAESRLAALRQPDSETYKLVLKMVSKMVGKEMKAVAAVRSSKIYLDSALSYHDSSFLKETFGYEFDAKPQGIYVSSPFLKAYAKCVMRGLAEQKSWKGEECVHVNGDIRMMVVRGFGELKVVRFYGDSTMHEVFFEEDNFVRRTLHSRNARMRETASQLWEQMSEGDGDAFSKRGAESVITGDTVFFDPLRVRCSLREVAAEVVRRGAQRAKGWLPFSMDILRAESGELYGGRVSFSVDMDGGKVVFFEKRDTLSAFEYRLSDYFSYLTRDPFVCDGAGFVLEMHGSPKDRLDWILTRVAAEDIATVSVEKMPVWSTNFDKPGLLVSLQVKLSISSDATKRVVLRDDPELFSKAVGSLVGGKAPITVAAARSARAMYRDQVMLPSGGVLLPKTSDVVVEEVLARAVYRRATFARVAMVVEETAAKDTIFMAESVRTSISRGVCSIMWSTGKDMIGAFKTPMTEIFEAALNDCWDVAVVHETPKMWLESCWAPVVSTLGGRACRDPAYWPTNVDRDVWDAATSTLARVTANGGVARFFSVDEEKVVKNVPLMGDQREVAAGKISRLTGAEERLVGRVRTVRPVVRQKPVLTPAVGVVNPEEAMKEEFDREFPGLSALDVDVRPYLVAESDRSICPNAPLMKVPLVDKAVPSSVYLSTGFNVGVSGPRPRSVNEVVAAFVGRVAGAPVYQWDVDLDTSLKVEFERFADVFLKEGWQDTVASRVSKGYMYPNQQEIRRVVSKMSPSNVSRVAGEDFRAEGVLMTVLKAMVKREPKDRQDISTAFEHKPNQTIMYQDSKITNAYFSAALGKFHDCLDDCLRDGFLINPRVDKKKVEEIWNSSAAFSVVGEGEHGKIVDVDISQCDKSQSVSNILRYMYLLCQFGFGDFTVLWTKMVEMKRASDPSVSVLVEFVGQVISGYFNTISANSCIVAWASANSVDVRATTVRRGVVSGDDVVLYVVSGEEVNLSAVSHRFSTQFNFDAKVNVSDDVLYWCGRLGVEVEGYTYFVKDLGRIRSSYFKSQGVTYDPEEAWESFLDDTEAYEYEELVVGVAGAYAKRRGLDFVPIGTARAVRELRRSKEMFLRRFCNRRVIG